MLVDRNVYWYTPTYGIYVVTGEYSIETEIEMVELEFCLISHLDRYRKNSNYLGMYGHLNI